MKAVFSEFDSLTTRLLIASWLMKQMLCAYGSKVDCSLCDCWCVKFVVIVGTVVGWGGSTSTLVNRGSGGVWWARLIKSSVPGVFALVVRWYVQVCVQRSQGALGLLAKIVGCAVVTCQNKRSLWDGVTICVSGGKGMAGWCEGGGRGEPLTNASKCWAGVRSTVKVQTHCGVVHGT